MPAAYCEKCRIVRLVVTALLIVFAAVAGYQWGHIFEQGLTGFRSSYVTLAAVGSAFIAIVLGLWAEVLVAQTEVAAAEAEAEKKRQAEAAEASKEHIAELERIVSLLTADNADLRYQLLSSTMHQAKEGEGGEGAAARPVRLAASSGKASPAEPSALE